MEIITATVPYPVAVITLDGIEETALPVEREACPLTKDIPFDGTIPLEAYYEPISQIADSRDAAM